MLDPSVLVPSQAALGQMRRLLASLPQTYETLVEIDKHEVLRRVDMLIMTAQGVLDHGARPDFVFSAQSDAAKIGLAAADAQAHAAWERGRNVASILVNAATLARSAASLITALGREASQGPG